MENASKALIIAGAILLAILLISLGIMIFSQAQDTVSNSGMSDADVSTFNNRFIKYEGDQKGSLVKSLVQEVIASNSDDNNSDKQIEINFKGKKTNNTATNLTGNNIASSVADTSKIYNVKISNYNTKGYVNQITIVEK